MIIRRVREHVASHDWFAVFVDLLIAILGVFIGIQVSNWNADLAQAATARDYRERLIDELDFNARQYALQAAYYQQARGYGLQALDDLNGSKRLGDSDFLIAAYQLTQTDATEAKTGVYDEMAANGLTDRLGDDETQNVASDFYLTARVAQRLLETVLPYRSLLREVMPYDVQLAIRSTCGDREVRYQGRLVGITLVVPCPLEIDPATARKAAQAIRSTPQLQRQMTRYIASLDEKIVNLRLAHEQAKAFRERLARARMGAAG